MAHTQQSRPDSVLGNQVKLRVVPSSLGLGFRVQGSGIRDQGSGFRVQGRGFRVEGSGFRVQGSG